MKKLAITLLLITIFITPSWANKVTTSNINLFLDGPYSKDKGFFIFNDVYDLARQPFKLFEQHSPLFWAGTIGALFLVDEPLTDFYLDEVEPFFEQLNIYPLLRDKNIFSTLYMINTLSYQQDYLLYKATYLSCHALINATFIAQGLKHVFGRARPVLADEGAYSWFNMDFDIFGKYTSFPSSHSTLYFTLFSTFGKVYQNEPLFDLLGLGTFLIMVGHNHWISDMWTGYLLGKAISHYVVENYNHPNPYDDWFFYPTVVPGSNLFAFGARKFL